MKAQLLTLNYSIITARILCARLIFQLKCTKYNNMASYGQILESQSRLEENFWNFGESNRVNNEINIKKLQVHLLSFRVWVGLLLLVRPNQEISLMSYIITAEFSCSFSQWIRWLYCSLHASYRLGLYCRTNHYHSMVFLASMLATKPRYLPMSTVEC